MKKTELFQGIAENEIGQLLSCLSAREHTFSKHDYIFAAGDTASEAGILVEGQLQIIKEDYWGNRTIIDILEPGDVFGEAFSWTETEFLPVSIMAAVKSRVLLMDYRRLVTTCSASCRFHSGVISNMLKIMAEKNLALMQKMEHITKRTTREKLLSYLSAQAVAKGSSFEIPFNRQELADYLSVDRSAMSAELGRMKEEGLIEFQKNRFVLLRK